MNAAKIAGKLLQINAIKLSPQKPFTWSSGLKSPVYCDNRIALSYPDVRRMIVDAFEERSKDYLPFDFVAGVATAGIAYGALLAEKMDLPMAYVRSKPKGHGRKNQIEGDITGGERVLVIEDLVSTGGSSLKAVHALKEAGCEILGTLAIFSYGFDQASTAFAEANCPLETLSNYDALLVEAISGGYISEEDQNMLQQWNKDPHAWSETYG